MSKRTLKYRKSQVVTTYPKSKRQGVKERIGQRAERNGEMDSGKAERMR
jgi:hypothetical protein